MQSRQVSQNSELLKKPEPGAQFELRRTSSTVQPHYSLRGSEAEPTTNPRYSSFRGYERLWRAVRHSRTNGASPLGLRRPSALGSDLRRGKILLAFHLHTASPDKDRPKYASLSASQWLTKQAYPEPHCVYIECIPVYWPSAFSLPRVIWCRIVEAPADVPQAEEVQPIGKGSKGNRTPPLCPLRTTSMEARFQTGHPP